MASGKRGQKDDNEGPLEAYLSDYRLFEEKLGHNGGDTPRVWPGFSTPC